MMERNPKAGVFGFVDSQVELHKLLLGEFWGFPIGVGQMGHESFQVKRRREMMWLKQFCQFTDRDTQASHAGFHFEMDRIGSGECCSGFCKGHEHGQVADHRCELVGEYVGDVPAEERAENHNRSVDARVAEGEAFLNRDHGDARDTLLNQRFGGVDSSMAVGIGFDDGHDVATRGEDAAKLGQIMGESCQIDSGVSW